MNRRLAGTFMVVLGAALLIVSLAFLHYFARGSATLWDAETAGPLSTTLIALIAAVLVLLSVPFGSVWLPLLAVCCSLYLFGHAFPIVDGYSGAGPGFWVGVAASAVMSLGSVLVLASAIRRA